MGHGKSRAIDRRQFVQASSVAAAALALGATGCASSHPVAETGGTTTQFVAGTYQATALGKKSDITVEVVFSDTAIDSVRVIDHGETERIAAPAFEKIPEIIVASQSLAVDAVTGATLSSLALLSAVEDCARQADGDVSALKRAEVPKEQPADEEIECDLAVIGAGISGMASALAAAQQGAKVVVFDKTGTLTRGVFEVTAVHHSPLAEEQLLEYAALAECASSHPISKSLQKAYGKEIDRSRVTDIEELSGHGITATVDGHAVAAGNSKLMEKLGVDCMECHSVGTVVHMAVNGKYAGHILISDQIKPHAKEAIAALKKCGVKKTIMLTGDRREAARQVAEELGIDEVHSELLPGDKVAQVEKLLDEKGEKEKLAFVGDGINDAPVLSRADIGIAMGALGSDAAIEAADIVLMDDDPLKISKAIRISRKCLRIVYENIYFAIGVKVVCLILGALGIANMWAAIFADVGVMIIAVLNAIRALNVKKL